MKQALFWIILNGTAAALDVATNSSILAALNGFVAGLWVCDLARDWRDLQRGKAA